MPRRKWKWGVAAGIFAVLGAIGNAQASTIDLFGLPGNFDQFTFGSTGTQYYAQSIQADGVHWADLAFGISNAAGGSFDLLITGGRAAAVPGTGLLPDAGAIFSQQTLNHAGGGLQIFDVNLDLAVANGTTYFFVLAAFGDTLAGASVRATQFNGTDKYAPGEFVFSNSNAAFSNSLSWASRFPNGEDLAFSATFDSGNNQVSQVPVPAALPLFWSALTALGLFGWRRRREASA